MIVMCMPYEGMSDDYADGLEQAATVITYIFIAEMFIKLVGLGCSQYWAHGWNQLDGTIVSLSLVEIAMAIIFVWLSYLGFWINPGLRTLRL